MSKLVSYDITFCLDGCKNTKCERHKSNLRNARGKGFYSVAYCKGTKYCPLGELKNENTCKQQDKS